MKTSILATLLGFTALFASAAPLQGVDELIKRQPIRRQVAATGTYAVASATGTGGVASPTGTSAPYPISTGSASCSTNGAVACNGPTEFGICNFGRVNFQPVAAGTKCVDGQIV